MTTLTDPAPAASVARWPAAKMRTLWIAAAAGAAWNAYGVVQWLATLGAAPDTMRMGGLNATQAALYASLPPWMTAAFAIGVFGGLLGCIALAWRRRWSVPLLVASLAGYVALFAGDAWFGLFAAIPGQLAILSVVLLIAGALLAAALVARSNHRLR